MDRSNEIHEYFVPHSNGHQLHLPTTLEQRTSGRFGLTNFKTFRQSDHLQLSPPSDKYNSQLNDYKELLIELILDDYDEPLGFSISGGAGKSLPFVISDIAAGSVAEIGGLKVGDQILEINSVRLRDFSPFDAVRFIRECSSQSESVQIKVQRRKLAIASGLRSYTTFSLDTSEHSDFEELPNDEVFGDEDYISRDSIKFSSISSMGSSDWDEFTKYNTDSKEISRKNSNSNLLEDDMREMNRMLDDKDTNDVVEATQSVTEFLKNSGPLELNVDQLERLFHQQNFQNAAELSSVIDRNWCEIPPSTPESREAALALDEVLLEIYGCLSRCAGEVQQLLSEPHWRSMLEAHDKIAKEIFDLEEFHDSFTAEKLQLKETYVGLKSKSSKDGTKPSDNVVYLEKLPDTPLGVTVKKDSEAVIVSRVVVGGAAEQSGSLHEGDEILEVNDVQLKHLTIDEVANLMSQLEGIVALKIVSKREVPIDTIPLMAQAYVKAMFDYDPTKDITHPCQELGLKFRKRDILRLVDTSDLNWWQGNIEGMTASLPGLIPSALHQKKRMNKNRSLKHPKNKSAISQISEITTSLRRGVSQTSHSTANQWNFDTIPYEEVVLYQQDPMNKRPIVLTGAEQSGAEELFWKLLTQNPDRFISPTIYTTKPVKSGSKCSGMYQTVSKDKFKRGIANERFLEWKLDKHFSGVTHQNVMKAADAGLTRLLLLKPESLSAIRTASYMPYIVCVVPPPFVRFSLNLRWTNPTIKDKEIHQIMEKSVELEQQYGELFDRLIVNYELEHVYEDILKLASTLETEPQWIPRKWLEFPS